MYVLGIAGPSGSGKTSLIERLVPWLAERGRVATVKAIHHDVDVDEPGKDTHRHRRAGAVATVGVTPSRTIAFVERGKERWGAGVHGRERHRGRDESAILEPLLAGYADRGVDYALVEGFARSSLPKVVVATADGVEAAEPVVARVEDGTSADPEPIVGRIHELRRFETTTSVAERTRASSSDRAVAVTSVESRGLATAAEWRHDDVDGTVDAIGDALHGRTAVEFSGVDLRPPVVPDGTATAHVAVVATEREEAFRAAAAAADRLVSTTRGNESVEFLVGEP